MIVNLLSIVCEPLLRFGNVYEKLSSIGVNFYHAGSFLNRESKQSLNACEQGSLAEE